MRIDKKELIEIIAESIIEQMDNADMFNSQLPNLKDDNAAIEWLETISYSFLQHSNVKNADSDPEAAKMVDKSLDFLESGDYNKAEAVLRKTYFRTKARKLLPPIMYLRDKMEADSDKALPKAKDHHSIKGRKKDYDAGEKRKKELGISE